MASNLRMAGSDEEERVLPGCDMHPGPIRMRHMWSMKVVCTLFGTTFASLVRVKPSYKGIFSTIRVFVRLL